MIIVRKIQILLIALFCSFTIASGQNALDNIGLTIATPSTAAYSLRQLSTTYAGSAIQVRRSSDNTTQNIGFTAGGDLDQPALLAFVGAGNGFVSIFYDQSGNGHNITQATLANQPRIVNAGVVDIQNGRPALFFNGTTYYMTQTTMGASNPYSASVVASRTVLAAGHRRLINFNSSGDFYSFIGTFSGNYATFTGNGTSAWNDVAANTPNTPIAANSVIYDYYCKYWCYRSNTLFEWICI